MVSPYTAGYPVDGGGIEEEPKHRICTVVIIGSDANHQSTLAINKCVDHNLPSN
jgi:hypothetical protein